MNDETTEQSSSIPSDPGSPQPAERTGRSRRRDRRGKGHQDRLADSAEPTESTSSDPDPTVVVSSPQVAITQVVTKFREFKRTRGQQGFGDAIDREICAFCVPVLPETYPVQGRPGIAVAEFRVIAEIGDRQLICNGLHTGDCAWADLTPLDPNEAVSRNWSIVVESGSPSTH